MIRNKALQVKAPTRAANTPLTLNAQVNAPSRSALSVDRFSQGKGRALREADVRLGATGPSEVTPSELAKRQGRAAAHAGGTRALQSGGGTRTREQALAEVEAHLIKSTGSPGRIGGTVRDYKDVTAPAEAETMRLLAQNKALADQARARLSTADQGRYDNLQAILASDPRAQLALQTMLIDGRLPGQPALSATTTDTECLPPLDLLAQLDLMSRAPTASGLVGASELLATTVKEVAFPKAISQGYKGTCTVTASGTALALQHPAEYVRIVMGLASPGGTVTMANGDTLTRESNTLAGDKSGRTVTQRLLGPALMEYGNGGLDYDSERDRSSLLVSGLNVGGTATVAAALFGRPFEAFDTPFRITTFGVGYRNAELLIEAFDAGKQPILFFANFPDGFQSHALMLQNVEIVNGTTYVTFQNPWGQEERVSYEELSARITAVIQPSD
jgi:hypothetical protein